MKLIIDIPYEAYYTFKSDLGKGTLNALAEIVANGTPVSNEGDLISRSELKKAINEIFDTVDVLLFDDIIATIDNAPTVELTEEQAIDKLHETGWLIRHDKEMTERPHIIDNCDMNVFEPEKYMEGGAV